MSSFKITEKQTGKVLEFKDGALSCEKVVADVEASSIKNNNVKTTVENGITHSCVETSHGNISVENNANARAPTAEDEHLIEARSRPMDLSDKGGKLEFATKAGPLNKTAPNASGDAAAQIAALDNQFECGKAVNTAFKQLNVVAGDNLNFDTRALWTEESNDAIKSLNFRGMGASYQAPQAESTGILNILGGLADNDALGGWAPNSSYYQEHTFAEQISGIRFTKGDRYKCEMTKSAGCVAEHEFSLSECGLFTAENNLIALKAEADQVFEADADGFMKTECEASFKLKGSLVQDKKYCSFADASITYNADLKVNGQSLGTPLNSSHLQEIIDTQTAVPGLRGLAKRGTGVAKFSMAKDAADAHANLSVQCGEDAAQDLAYTSIDVNNKSVTIVLYQEAQKNKSVEEIAEFIANSFASTGVSVDGAQLSNGPSYINNVCVEICIPDGTLQVPEATTQGLTENYTYNPEMRDISEFVKDNLEVCKMFMGECIQTMPALSIANQVKSELIPGEDGKAISAVQLLPAVAENYWTCPKSANNPDCLSGCIRITMDVYAKGDNLNADGTANNLYKEDMALTWFGENDEDNQKYYTNSYNMTGPIPSCTGFVVSCDALEGVKDGDDQCYRLVMDCPHLGSGGYGNYGFYYYSDQLSERLVGDCRGDLNRGWQLPLSSNQIPAGQDNIQHWVTEGSFKNCQVGPRMGHSIEDWKYNPSSERNLFWDNYYSMYRDYGSNAPKGLHGTWGAIMSLDDLKAKALVNGKYTVQTLEGPPVALGYGDASLPNYGSQVVSLPIALPVGTCKVNLSTATWASEFSFHVKNAEGVSVASGTSTTTEVQIPSAGDYTFENNDSYGDGGWYVDTVQFNLDEPINTDKDFVDIETYAADMELSVHFNILADGETLCISQKPLYWRSKDLTYGGPNIHDFSAATAEACNGLFDNGRMAFNEKNIFIGDLSVAVFSNADIKIGDTLSTADGSQNAVATKDGEITIPFTMFQNGDKAILTSHEVCGIHKPQFKSMKSGCAGAARLCASDIVDGDNKDLTVAFKCEYNDADDDMIRLDDNFGNKYDIKIEHNAQDADGNQWSCVVDLADKNLDECQLHPQDCQATISCAGEQLHSGAAKVSMVRDYCGGDIYGTRERSLRVLVHVNNASGTLRNASFGASAAGKVTISARAGNAYARAEHVGDKPRSREELREGLGRRTGRLSGPEGDRSYCSCTLIGAGLWMTANHCVDEQSLGQSTMIHVQEADKSDRFIKCELVANMPDAEGAILRECDLSASDQMTPIPFANCRDNVGMDHGDKTNGRPWDGGQRFRMLEYESDGISNSVSCGYRPLLAMPEVKSIGGSSGSGTIPRYGINAQRYCGHLLGGASTYMHYAPIAFEKNRAAQAMFAGSCDQAPGVLDAASNLQVMFPNGPDMEQSTFTNQHVTMDKKCSPVRNIEGGLFDSCLAHAATQRTVDNEQCRQEAGALLAGQSLQPDKRIFGDKNLELVRDVEFIKADGSSSGLRNYCENNHILPGMFTDAFSAGYVKVRFQMKPHRPNDAPVLAAASDARVENGCFEGFAGEITHNADGSEAFYYLSMPLTGCSELASTAMSGWFYKSGGTPEPQSEDPQSEDHKKRACNKPNAC